MLVHSVRLCWCMTAHSAFQSFTTYSQLGTRAHNFKHLSCPHYACTVMAGPLGNPGPVAGSGSLTDPPYDTLMCKNGWHFPLGCNSKGKLKVDHHQQSGLLLTKADSGRRPWMWQRSVTSGNMVDTRQQVPKSRLARVGCWTGHCTSPRVVLCGQDICQLKRSPRNAGVCGNDGEWWQSLCCGFDGFRVSPSATMWLNHVNDITLTHTQTHTHTHTHTHTLFAGTVSTCHFPVPVPCCPASDEADGSAGDTGQVGG